MEKLKVINEVKHSLIDAVKAETAKGLHEIDAKELGEVVDMIKDLAEAEEACMEACYYEAVTEAMTDDGEGRYGYDGWRYASGRFAPKGRGSRTRGYLPSPVVMEEHAMGYADGRIHDDRSDRYGYTETRMGFDGEPKDKLEKAMGVMGEVWDGADREMRAKMKASVKDLLYQMEQADR